MIYEKLYDWQKNIIDTYKDRKSFGVFLDCGLGKTAVSLAFAEKNQADKILVITINSKATESNSVSGSWLWWAEKMDKVYRPLTKKSKPSELGDQQDSIFIVNYEALYTRGDEKRSGVQLKDNIKEFIKSCKGKRVAIIIDESHKMKDTQSLQTKAINKIKKELMVCANNVYIYLATGTPYTKDFVDLYSQLNFLGCPLNKTTFIDKFCVRGNVRGLLGWQQPIVAYKNLDELFNLVHQYAITMKSSDVIKLPDQITIDHPLPPSHDFKLFTSKLLSDKIVEAELCSRNQTSAPLEASGKKVPNPFYRNIAYPDLHWFADTSGSYWLRSRQLSIGFQGNAEECEWFDRTRLAELKKFLSDNEDNYVLFYNYTPELVEIYDICQELGYKIDVYSGEIKNLSNYEKYEAQPAGERITNTKNIILSNFASGSTGKNWQCYNKCIIFSLPLYKDYEQALKRIHRIGQKDTVVYHIFSQKNFLDNGMWKALMDKKEYTEQMFESDLETGGEYDENS